MPARLAWKKRVGSELTEASDVSGAEAEFSGSVTAIVEVEGDLSGRAWYVFSRQTALGVRASVNTRWIDDMDQKAFDAVGAMVDLVVGNVPSLLEAAGYNCQVKQASTVDANAEPIENPADWPAVVYLSNLPDESDPSSKNEIVVWFDLRDADGNVPEDEENEIEFSPKFLDLTASEVRLISGIQQDLKREDDADLLERLNANVNYSLTDVAGSGFDLDDMLAGDDADGGVKQQQPSLPQIGEGDAVFPSAKIGLLVVEKLEITDAEGRRKLVVGTQDDGSPYLAMANNDGSVRTVLRLDANGDAELLFTDDLGNRTWQAPDDSAASETPASPAAAPTNQPPPGEMRRRPPPHGKGRPRRPGAPRPGPAKPGARRPQRGLARARR